MSNFSYQTIKYRSKNFFLNSQIEKRYTYAVNFSSSLSESKKMIFIDESSIKMDLQPKKAYCENGSYPQIPLSTNSQNISLIMAITENSILGYMFFDSSVKCMDFFIFIIELLAKKPHLYKERKDYIFVIDGARSHFAKCIATKLNETIKILQLAPNSPFLNPIEEVFGLLKLKLRS